MTERSYSLDSYKQLPQTWPSFSAFIWKMITINPVRIRCPMNKKWRKPDGPYGIHLKWYWIPIMVAIVKCLQRGGTCWHQELFDELMILLPRPLALRRVWQVMYSPRKLGSVLAWRSHCRRSWAKWNLEVWIQMLQVLHWCPQRKEALQRGWWLWPLKMTGKPTAAWRCELRIDRSWGLQTFALALHLWVASKPEFGPFNIFISKYIWCRAYNIGGIYNRNKSTYQADSWYLQEGENIGHQENPTGQQSLLINHKICKNSSLGLIAKCPIPRYGNTEKCGEHNSIAHAQAFKHLPLDRRCNCCLPRRRTTIFVR